MRIVNIVLFLLIILACNSCLYGQEAYHTHHKKAKKSDRLHHRYGLWVTPVQKSTVIDGIAAGVVALPIGENKTLRVNGINVEANPIPPVAVIIMTVGGLITVLSYPFTKKENRHKMGWFRKHLPGEKKDPAYAKRDTVARATINGLSISTGTMFEETRVNGVAINILFAAENEMNGVEIGGLLSSHNKFTGLVAAGVNLAKNGKGMQVGIYNRCEKGNVLQIGLLNKIGKRTIPFLNFHFRRHKNEIE